jgi:hypothetical protein
LEKPQNLEPAEKTTYTVYHKLTDADGLRECRQVQLTKPMVIGLFDSSYRNLTHGDAENAVKVTHPVQTQHTVMGLLEGLHRNLTIGYRVRQCSKADTTRGDRPFRWFLLQVDPTGYPHGMLNSCHKLR